MRLRRALFALLSASLMGPGAAASQTLPIRWTLSVPDPLLEQGRPFRALVHADIPAGSHLYALTQQAGGPMAARIVVDSGDAFVLAGDIAARNADRAVDPNFGFATDTYTDSVTFAVPIVARSAGAQRLVLSVQYQSCTDRLCLPPRTVPLSLDLAVNQGATISGSGYSILPVGPRVAGGDTAAQAGAITARHDREVQRDVAEVPAGRVVLRRGYLVLAVIGVIIVALFIWRGAARRV